LRLGSFEIPKFAHRTLEASGYRFDRTGTIASSGC
jgi:hypothetical protein